MRPDILAPRFGNYTHVEIRPILAQYFPLNQRTFLGVCGGDLGGSVADLEVCKNG